MPPHKSGCSKKEAPFISLRRQTLIEALDIRLTSGRSNPMLEKASLLSVR